MIDRAQFIGTYGGDGNRLPISILEKESKLLALGLDDTGIQLVGIAGNRFKMEGMPEGSTITFIMKDSEV